MSRILFASSEATPLIKTGGLAEAMALYDAARAEGYGVMVGCMMATSLSIAPATIVTPAAYA